VRRLSQSGYWLGSSFLFSTPAGISYLTIEGIVRPLCSLDVSGAVITAVLNDRIVYACPAHDRTQIRSQPVGLLEPLLMVRHSNKREMLRIIQPEC
jgi:hypothetical protein